MKKINEKEFETLREKFPNLHFDDHMFENSNELKYMGVKLKPKEEFTITEVSGYVTETRVNVTISLSNGDVINSTYNDLYINNRKLMHDLDKFHGSTGSCIGDILLAYCELKGLKIHF